MKKLKGSSTKADWIVSIAEGMSEGVISVISTDICSFWAMVLAGCEGWDRGDCETRINFGRYARLAAVIGSWTRWSGILSPCFDQAQSQSRISGRTYICSFKAL